MNKSEVLDRKADAIFGKIDVDGDGVIAQDDYRADAHRILAGYNVDAESPRGQAVNKTLLAIWEVLARDLDADRDGRITREEFRAGFRKPPAGYFDGYVAPMLRAKLTIVDADGDGLIGRQEYIRWRRVEGEDEHTAAQVFEKADTDGDDRLSVEEYLHISRTFLSDNTDPDEVGNMLYSHV